MNLLEAYSRRLDIADQVHRKSHQNQPLNESKKIMIAKCLENTQKFMTEAYGGNSMGTQRSDMGLFTKFSLVKSGASIGDNRGNYISIDKTAVIA